MCSPLMIKIPAKPMKLTAPNEAAAAFASISTMKNGSVLGSIHISVYIDTRLLRFFYPHKIWRKKPLELISSPMVGLWMQIEPLTIITYVRSIRARSLAHRVWSVYRITRLRIFACVIQIILLIYHSLRGCVAYCPRLVLLACTPIELAGCSGSQYCSDVDCIRWIRHPLGWDLP